MDTTNKAHLRICILWFFVVIAFSLICAKETFEKMNITDPVKCVEYYLILLAMYLVVYIIPVFLFRFKFIGRPILSLKTSLSVVFMFLCAAAYIDTKLYSVFFNISVKWEEAIRVHGFLYFTFILHAGARKYRQSCTQSDFDIIWGKLQNFVQKFKIKKSKVHKPKEYKQKEHKAENKNRSKNIIKLKLMQYNSR